MQIECDVARFPGIYGKGYATDRAVILGLLGIEPHNFDADKAEIGLAELHRSHLIIDKSLGTLAFNPDIDLQFDYGSALPLHPNGMKLFAIDADGQVVFSQTYYSIGGGFIFTEAELLAEREGSAGNLQQEQKQAGYPYPFGSVAEMLKMGRESGLTIAELKRANEETTFDPDELCRKLASIWQIMNTCIDRGLSNEGELLGGLHVKRRAKAIKDKLESQRPSDRQLPHAVNDWLLLYAMAVNEENSAGGQVVTSPTNGAAGVVPSVIRYYLDHCGGTCEGVETFLLTAAAVGGIIKHNASISGAECGCQAEIGSAAAMAAAGLCVVLGGNNEQVENAAEIALEHHLGLTCDPVAGLVQVPCIERNGIGAIKAVSAASLALHGDGSHFMPLDNCIETMRQTGSDMADKYKETSLGGLAVNLPGC